MKKSICVLLLLILVFLTACSAGANQPNSESETQEVVTSSVTDTEPPTADVTDSEVSRVYAEYINILKEKKKEITNYTFQYSPWRDPSDLTSLGTPIAIEDITGDDIPELIVVYAPDDFSTSLSVYSYTGKKSEEILSIDKMTIDVGGGALYVLYKTKDEPYLNLLHESNDGTKNILSVSVFKPNGKKLKKKVINERSFYIDIDILGQAASDQDPAGYIDLQTDKAFTFDEYKKEVRSVYAYMDNIDKCLVLGSSSGGSDLKEYISDDIITSLSYDEAIELLKAGK